MKFGEIIDQIFIAAIESFPIVVFSISFVGAVLILELSFHMKMIIQQDSLVPAFSTLLLIRELGPVVTSILLSSRLGASYAAEIGTMKLTEQIDAMKILGFSLTQWILLPRFLACVFASLTLSIVSISVGILSASMVSSLKLSIHFRQFFQTLFSLIHTHDFIVCIVKAIFFGAIIAGTSCFYGLKCTPGAKGVGNASTHAVVHSTLLIIIFDFVLTYLFYRV